MAPHVLGDRADTGTTPLVYRLSLHRHKLLTPAHLQLPLLPLTPPTPQRLLFSLLSHTFLESLLIIWQQEMFTLAPGSLNIQESFWHCGPPANDSFRANVSEAEKVLSGKSQVFGGRKYRHTG